MTPDYAALLAAIQRDPRYQKHLSWGQPRPGHPEGTVQAHIEELERNLDLLAPKLTAEQVGRVRLLIHTHDTFKAEAARGVAIRDPRSHASRARAFLAEFIADDLLAMVHLHDEPFALWRQARGQLGGIKGKRFDALLAAIAEWNTFLAFLIVDNCTAGKGREPLRWFLPLVAGRVQSRFSVADFFR